MLDEVTAETTFDYFFKNLFYMVGRIYFITKLL